MGRTNSLRWPAAWVVVGLAILNFVSPLARAAGDLSRQTPIEVVVELGKPGMHGFFPNKLRFETGKLYKLILKNASEIRTTSLRTLSRSSSSRARCK